MPTTQNRYTYPMANSRPISLQFHLRQKFYLSDYWEGIQLKEGSQNRVDIYRYVGQVSHRFNIEHYNHLNRNWDENNITLNQRMLTKGWEFVQTISSNNILLTNNRTSAVVDVSTQSEGMNQPGYYRDIWRLQIDPSNEIIGPVVQSFRLESRTFGIYGGAYRPPMYFDVQIYPTVWPAGSKSFPVAISVLPMMGSTGDPFLCEALKSILSNARVEISGIYQIEDEDGTEVESSLLSDYSYPIIFENQYFNWFYKNLDVSGLSKNGKFRVAIKIKFAGGWDSGYGEIEAGTFRPHWKEIQIDKSASSFGTAPSVSFFGMDIPAMSEILCSPGSSGLAAYDTGNQQLMPVGGQNNVSRLFEPRTAEPLRPYFQPSPPSQQILTDLVQIDFTNVAGSVYLTSQVPTGSFPFMVIADGLLLRPDNPLDGTGTQYDYSLSGQTLTVHTVGWFNFLQLIYAYEGAGTLMGQVAQEVFLPGDGALVGGGPTWAVGLSNVPNNIFSVVSMDGVTIPQGASGEYIFNGSTIETTSQPTDKLIVTYSYGSTDIGPNSVIREIFAGGGSSINLTNTPDNFIPPIIWDNGVHLYPDQGATQYDYTISGKQIVFHSAPAGPAVHVVYSY